MDSKGNINDLGEQYIGGNATTHSSGAPPAFAFGLGFLVCAASAAGALLS